MVEGYSVPLNFTVPIYAPSVDMAMEFIEDLAPATILSQGTSRRAKSPQLIPCGAASDRGFLVFHRQSGDAAPLITPMRSKASIRSYLAKAAVHVWDNWLVTQISVYRSGRDGQVASYSKADARHILGLTVDMDGSRMTPELYGLLQADWPSFRALLADSLQRIGVQWYRLVRTSRDGLHLHLKFSRPDGMPLRANTTTLAVWERVARGMHRLLRDFGADANAVRLTQPFILPGIPRAKHLGFVPYVIERRDGAATDLYALLRHLSRLKLMMRRSPTDEDAAATPVPALELSTLLMEIKSQAKGLVIHSGRNKAAHDLAVYLLAKGASPDQVWDALDAWNQRNTPPLRERELRRCFESARKCPDRHDNEFTAMRHAAWFRLRGLLGLSVEGLGGFLNKGRWQPLTPPRSWEDRKLNGGREHYHEVAQRFMSHLQAHDDPWEITQVNLAELLGTALSTLKVVLKRLQEAERVQVVTKRGRGGKSRFTMIQQLDEHPVENSQCSKAPEGVKKGGRAGDPVPCLQESHASDIGVQQPPQQDRCRLVGSGDLGTFAKGDSGQPHAEIAAARVLVAIWVGPGRWVIAGYGHAEYPRRAHRRVVHKVAGQQRRRDGPNG